MNGHAGSGAVIRLPVPDADRWLAWLRENTDPDWRPTQWRHDRWMFTGTVDDPTTSVTVCRVLACPRIVSRTPLCARCKGNYTKLGSPPMEEYIVSHVPNCKVRGAADYSNRPSCAAERGGQRCPRAAVTIGLCVHHNQRWRLTRKKNPGLTFDQWLETGEFSIPDSTYFGECTVAGCDRETRGFATSLCSMHSLRYSRQGDHRPISEWIKTQPPHIADHQFSLIHVDEVLRWEVLYAVQQRDARGGRIEPHAIRTALASMQTVTSLSTMSEADAIIFLKRHGENSTAAHLAEFVRHLRRGHDRMNGLGPKDRLVWDLVEIGLSPDPTAIGGTRKRKGLDFGQISQPWLRDLALGWAREQATARGISETLRVSVIASQALDTRHDRGVDMTALGERDIATIIDAIDRTITAADGTPVQAKYKRQLANFLFALIEWGRHFGHLPDLPVLFRMPHRSATPFENVVDEEPGKAIPNAIQRQLDENVDSIGRDSTFRGLTEEQAHQMFRTAYIVLRDTGRRPLEVVTLTTSCLTRDHSGSVLTWNNYKSKRFGRRLPILESTAQAIQQWMDVRSTLTTADRSADYLFPGKAVKSLEPHLRTHWLSSAIRRWVDGFDRLDTHDLGDDGEPIPFDRMLVYPYAFRHSYAQRHADNGTPIDVLRDLMDHRNIQTTAGYYVVTADRKREAIAAVGKYSVDRVGNSTPTTDSTAYQMRSVAVPFGNCIEPTNVKAGGHACPIRFQCAGCGFYRPDPSYLPAIEEHLNTLRSDREIARAMDTAPYVIENLTAQITSFDHVLTTMRDKLAQLDPAERGRVEDAATVLRRARAGVLIPLTVTVTERTTPS